MTSCKVNEIFLGEVSSVQNYGAFVKIPGCSQQGLVHKTQISSVRVDDVSEVLQKGERIWCKIISIDENGKIALSMKLVNQGNGKDLDPNGVQLQLDQQKKKTLGSKDSKKVIVLDAVFNTTCTKCKTRGHLAKDCFSTPDGKKYELIPEILEEPVSTPTIENEIKIKEKKHKSKKSRKRKKNKSSKEEYSDSENTDSPDEQSKKKMKKSKEKKHKKKKHDTSSDSDLSDKTSNSYENKKHSKKCKHSRARDSD